MAGSKAPPTIQEVAELAGVSKSTISRYFSGFPVRNPEQIRAAVERLGYRPNSAARDLKNGRTRTVGVAVRDLADLYFARILRAIGLASSEVGFHLLVADTSLTSERLAYETLRQRADGLILCAPQLDDSELESLVDDLRPVVIVDRLAPGVRAPQVGVDFYAAMLGLIAHTMDLGHRRIAYFAGPPRSWGDRERRRAFETAKTFGAIPTILEAADSDQLDAAINTALSDGTTAILSFDDFIASSTISRLRKLDVSVPDEISVTGFDDVGYASLSNPEITTVRTPLGDLGERAWSELRALIEGAEATATSVLLPAEVVVRASVAAIAKA
ncbi:LacI family DNA-binding transcriptional regulator [Sinosporangium siamense]|uniref:LacI family transcriptional regulator n=1 Tax=Sinosporangium siamense TaxID=1367973 RepID=A0A919RKN9_9ACTN|nr:LacI family DNA-binding transcriptional regulator [Sinosporangium siamense]GII95548.1 hypothetical protein Ssi02_57790 [Sinosporangium siamense]